MCRRCFCQKHWSWASSTAHHTRHTIPTLKRIGGCIVLWKCFCLAGAGELHGQSWWDDGGSKNSKQLEKKKPEHPKARGFVAVARRNVREGYGGRRGVGASRVWILLRGTLCAILDSALHVTQLVVRDDAVRIHWPLCRTFTVAPLQVGGSAPNDFTDQIKVISGRVWVNPCAARERSEGAEACAGTKWRPRIFYHYFFLLFFYFRYIYMCVYIGWNLTLLKACVVLLLFWAQRETVHLARSCCHGNDIQFRKNNSAPEKNTHKLND